ncbi:MAG: hypothetical protein ACJ8EB_07190 [Allosphingosinicella sp.]
MAALGRIERNSGMATRWRRRRMCVLLAPAPSAAALRDVSARGAFVETAARPGIGAHVELRHPEAGSIQGVVRSVSADGVQVSFACTEDSVGFALMAIASDMTRG